MPPSCPAGCPRWHPRSSPSAPPMSGVAAGCPCPARDGHGKRPAGPSGVPNSPGVPPSCPSGAPQERRRSIQSGRAWEMRPNVPTSCPSRPRSTPSGARDGVVGPRLDELVQRFHSAHIHRACAERLYKAGESLFMKLCCPPIRKRCDTDRLRGSSVVHHNHDRPVKSPGGDA